MSWDAFVESWGESALTTVSFFWMAFWAFALGYVISSCIQVFVTRERMRRAMGESGPKSMALATVFGFISSSCSFAALATSKALFKKGAGLAPALAFMLASTNLVIELGILIAVFLSWHFVVGEYLGGVLLILVMWLIVRLTLPKSLEEQARQRAQGEGGQGDPDDWRELIRSWDGWRRVAERYFMEWGMVWRDVTFGFTVAGVISAFVPREFFTWLFVGAGSGDSLPFWQVLAQTVVGPVAAFCTFIGSMGNIPLASLLLANGVSFAGVMAFIFSDLVVFPVLRINAKYYGWKMALYILAVFLVSLVAASLALHYGFALAGLLPQGGASESVEPTQRFGVDYTLFLNLLFAALTVGLWRLAHSGQDDGGGHSHGGGSPSAADRLLTWLAWASLAWLVGGLAVWAFTSW
ncbi:permease [Botrimarina sp.]|uniref:permease n=1 Tax=Botrimarina sp. TaxID=2795802 RepID=UPI0032EF9ACC